MANIQYVGGPTVFSKGVALSPKSFLVARGLFPVAPQGGAKFVWGVLKY